MTSQPILNIAEAHSPFVFGIDVGGTGIKIGLVDDHGNTVGFRAIPTEEPRGPADAMRRVAATCHEMLAELGLSLRDVRRAGLGTPGSQDIPKGMLIEPPNHPHWHHFPIVACLEKEIGLPVSFANDANAAAFGEFWVGTGRVYRSMVMLTLGTGVGGGVIVDDRLVVGQNSFGGECGHLIVDSSPEARLCVWGGGRGHLEAYASASAVAARAQEKLAAGAASSLQSLQQPVTAKRVYEAALQKDSFSLELIDETAEYLGIGIATLVHILDPGLVVLGGAMDFGGNDCPIGQRFLTETIRSFHQRSFEYVAQGTRVEFASLGGDAGYLGAAGIARVDHSSNEKESE
ncbi:ROK family protein [Pirellulaceae bacterium SH467]